MKVIFLDFDGVLNSREYLRRTDCAGVGIDPSRMVLLKQIVDNTNALIVLSTSWREHWESDISACNEVGVKINRIFSKYGLTIFDKTPKSRLGRAEEIKQWLKMNSYVKKFVILDDSFMELGVMSDYFVKTSNYRNGLEEEDVKKAITILNKAGRGWN